MKTLTLEIPKKAEVFFNLEQKNINITDLFKTFWIDFDFIIEEKKYSNDFLKDIKNKNYTINNSF